MCASPLIDSHAHLLHLRGPLTPEQALEGARQAGVITVVNIGNDPSDNEAGIQLAERIPGLPTTVGWHPHAAVDRMTSGQRKGLRRLVSHPAVVAIGEIGLDYHYTDYHQVPPKVQAWTFRELLALSQESEKPVVLHTRDAFPQLLAILDEFPGVGGVFHCFSGDVALATEAHARGFHLSFAATVTYPNASGIQAAAQVVPLDRLLVETDAPFLPPQSRRGQANAPAYLPETVERIAALRQTTAVAVADATSQNARRLFGLKG